MDVTTDRHAALRDRANYAGPSLVDQFGEQAAVLGAGDPAAEGITLAKLAAIRRSALRSAAAGAALDAAGDSR